MNSFSRSRQPHAALHLCLCVSAAAAPSSPPERAALVPPSPVHTPCTSAPAPRPHPPPAAPVPCPPAAFFRASKTSCAARQQQRRQRRREAAPGCRHAPLTSCQCAPPTSWWTTLRYSACWKGARCCTRWVPLLQRWVPLLQGWVPLLQEVGASAARGGCRCCRRWAQQRFGVGGLLLREGGGAATTTRRAPLLPLVAERMVCTGVITSPLRLLPWRVMTHPHPPSSPPHPTPPPTPTSPPHPSAPCAGVPRGGGVPQEAGTPGQVRLRGWGWVRAQRLVSRGQGGGGGWRWCWGWVDQPVAPATSWHPPPRPRLGPIVKLRDRRYGRTFIAVYGPPELDPDAAAAATAGGPG